MKLDPRIIEGKRPLDCLDVDIAKIYIGQKGYFAICLCAFQDLKSIDYHLTYATLKEVNSQKTMAFADDFDGDEFSYFLPEEWVKEPEKKYRPFSIEDWKLKHSIGETVLYRYKGTYCGDHSEAELAYLGYIKPLDGITDEAGKGQIVLGNNAHGLQNLFDDYEIWVDGGWKPFGIEIEE